MSRPITIRAYVVGFGDCILLSLPDGSATRQVLVDFGRAPNDAESLQRFPAIAKDIEKVCGGHLDLVIATHEHLDHIEGFYRERAVFGRIQVDQVWLGLPSHPKYYTDYPKAQLKKRLHSAVSAFAARARTKGMVLHPGFRSLLENNLSNQDRMNYLRKLGSKPVTYLARGRKGTAALRWSKNIKVHVLAPEEDTSVYYASGGSRARLRALAAAEGVTPPRGDEGLSWTFPEFQRATPGDHRGFSPSDFDRLRCAIREDGVAAARFIDRAENNTSLCLIFEVAGKRLMLAGDAELESWAFIRKHCRDRLKPLDFLKVSHHGSHNGTPTDLLDTLLPIRRAARATVLVSTKRNVYGIQNPVPDQALMNDLKQRCRQLVTTDGVAGTCVTVTV